MLLGAARSLSLGAFVFPLAMIILGVDPGSNHTGYAVVETHGRRETVLACGTLHLDPRADHNARLKEIYDRLGAIVEEHLPDECAVEMPIYGKNPQSMLKLGRAQAAAMLVALNRQIPVTQYTPAEVKKSVTGNGNASKEQVAYMVRSMVRVGEVGLDASDALAVALCHVHRASEISPVRHKNWAAFAEANAARIVG
jgi:crossover junction endodeoxyribonuclease RuvC